MNRKKTIETINRLKADHPDQTLIVETPVGTLELRIGDAAIYEGTNREIVIDSE